MEPFAHGGRYSLQRILSEISEHYRRTGEPPREIILTPQEMADLINDPAIAFVLSPWTARIMQIADVPIREQP